MQIELRQAFPLQTPGQPGGLNMRKIAVKHLKVRSYALPGGAV
jgi:hypothetical protein